MSDRLESRKAERKRRERSERQAGRDLDRLTDEALAIALDLVGEVASATGAASSREIEVEFPTVDAARFAQKRINEALGVREWSDDVRARVVLSGEDGFELRLERQR